MKTDKVATSTGSFGQCPYCLKLGKLCMSHAIPKSAFKTMMVVGNGNAIGIPPDNGNVHLTSDSGAGLLLCGDCEGIFNRSFDGPTTNALKALDTAIISNGFRVQISFEANQLAHAVVAMAWRMCLSPAHMYSEVILSDGNLKELDTLMRKPTSEILRHCSVRVFRLSDPTPEASGGFGQNEMRQIILTPKAYSIMTNRNGKLDRFGIDWTMFSFLIQLIVPGLPFAKSKKFGGLKLGATRVATKPINILDYPPLRDAIISGFSAQQQGRIAPNLKNRTSRTK